MQPHKDFFSQLRKVHAGGGSSKATDPADDLEHLRTNPPQRKINAARRAHHKAVNTLVARSTDARAIALGGLEAVRQAELRTEAIDVTSSSAVPAAAARAEAADMASLRAAYAQAVGVDSSASPDRDSELKAWGLVFGIAQGIVDAAEGAASGGEVESAYRAQMTSLTRQAAIYESQGLLRSAINALERIVELAGSGSVGRDAATLRGVGSVARRLAELNARIGNVDKSRHYITLAASLSKQLPASSGAGPKAAGPAAAAPSDEGALSDEASSVSPAGAAEVLDGGARKPEHASLGSDIPAESGVSEAAEGLSRATASAAPVADAALTAAVPPAVEAAPVPPSAAESNPVAPAAAEVAAAADVPTPTPQWPSFPESDTSPPAVFTRLMTRAMFHGDFEPLKATLNRSLLGDGTASATLRLQMPGFRVTALMAAAAGDRPDIVRRVLGLYAPAEAPLQVVGVRDAAGNNALAHALHLGQLRALDELLRCAASHAPVAAAAPAASSTNLLPLSTLGLSVAQVTGAPAPAQTQLRAFCGSPARYLAEYKPPLEGGPAAPARPPAAAVGGVGCGAAGAPPLRGMPLPPALAFALAAHQARTAALMLSAAAATGARMAAAQAPAPTASHAPAAAAPAGQKPAAAPVGQKPAVSAPAPKPAPAPARPAAHAVPAAAPAPAAGADAWTSAPRKGGRGGKAAAASAQASGATTKAGSRSAPAPAGTARQSSNVSIAAREGKLAGRELQPFAFGGEGSGSLGGLEDGGEKQGGRGGEGKGSGGRAWDQFAANEALFGVRAGFPEAAYTTTLNLAAFTPEQLARADALVASIAAGGAGADDEAGSDGSETGDEEARFSAVRRPATKAEAARADAFTDAGVAARIGAAAATSAAPPAAGSGAAAGAGKSATVAAVSGAAPAAGTASSARRGAAHAGGKTR
jgi:hypothetical protein